MTYMRISHIILKEGIFRNDGASNTNIFLFYLIFWRPVPFPAGIENGEGVEMDPSRILSA